MPCKNNCSDACANNKTSADLPAAGLIEIVDISGLTSILTTIAATGIKNLVFKDTGLEQLARKVSSLAAENNYLRKLAALLSPVSAEHTTEEICLHFGPGSAYTLRLPITSSNRQELAEQFAALAKQLAESTTAEKLQAADPQLPLFN